MRINNRFFKTCIILVVAVFFVFAADCIIAQPSIRLFQNTNNAKLNSALSVSSTYLSVNHQALASVLVTPHFILRGVPLPSVAGLPQSADLDLTEFSVLCEKTKITYQVGDKEIPAPMPTVRTYRGKVIGDPNTLTCIAVEPGGNVSGFIRFDGRENFSISVASRSDSYTSVITPMSTISGDLTKCEMTDESKFAPKGIIPAVPHKSSGDHIQSALTATQTCVVAIDEDNACYQEFGDMTDYITARMAAITVVYENEIGIAMAVGPLHIWTTPDPYSGNNSSELLQSFTNYWIANHQSDADQRTLAHLVSRRIDHSTGAQGIAWVAGMCSPDQLGYALTNISGTYTGVDEAVMAHELGHNVGSYHTHNCQAYPPSGLDHCTAGEPAGVCNWSIVQTIGCIMSYCNQKDFSFHTRQGDDRVVTTLQDAVAAVTCLATLATITVNDTAINFPKTVFNTSKDSTIKAVITNNGTAADLKILGADVEGLNPDQFSIKNPPKFPVVLTTGQSMTLTVTFKPTDGNFDTAQLRIAHNATGGSSYIQLTGKGAIPVGTFFHQDYTLDFGSVTDRNPIDSTLIYVQNDGDAPLKITRSWFTTDTAEFSIVSGKAPVFIAPGAQGSMVIQFKAKTNGLKSTVFLDFKSDDPSTDTSSVISSVQVQANVSQLGVASSSENEPQLLISPNPFSGKLQIEIQGGQEYYGKSVSVNIFDNLGRKVGVINGGQFNTASQKLVWMPDATVSEGAYTLVAKIGEQEIVKQIVYVK
jgi:hypothetical protein